MKPRRTITSTGVLRLESGNEDNDLWYESHKDVGLGHFFETVWQPTDEERAAIADGGNVQLLVWGSAHPPVAMAVTGVRLGRPE